MRTKRRAYSAHGARVSCVENATEPVVQSFWDIVGCIEVVEIREGLEPLVDSGWSDNHVFELFDARKVGAV